MIAAATDTAQEQRSSDAFAPASILPSAARMAGSRVARGLFRMVLLLVAARALGPQEFGIYGLLFTVTETLMFISGGGFVEYITRESARDPNTALSRARQVTELRWAYVVALIVVAWAALRVLAYPGRILAASLVFSISLFPRAVLDSSKGLLRGAQKFTRVLLLEVVEGTVLLAAALLLLARGGRLWSLIAAEIAAAFVGATVSVIAIRHLFPGGVAARLPWIETVRRTIAFNLYSVIADIYDRVDIVLLSKLAGNVAVGLYVMPYRILPMLQVVPYGLMSVVLVLLSAPAGQRQDKAAAHRVLGLLYAASLLFVLETVLLADTGVHLFLGASYAASALVLKVVIWALVPMFVNHTLNTYLLANHKEHWFVGTASVCTVVNITANLLLIPRYSYLAAAAVTILTELVLLTQNLVLIKRVIGFVPRPQHLFASTAMFALLLASALFAVRLLSPVIVAAIAGIVFCLYVYCKVWGATVATPAAP